jgi:hypothetical protein
MRKSKIPHVSPDPLTLTKLRVSRIIPRGFCTAISSEIVRFARAVGATLAEAVGEAGVDGSAAACVAPVFILHGM